MTAEKHGPYLLALVAPAVYFVAVWKFSFAPTGESLEKLFGGTLDLASILVGFLSTSKALLFAVPDRRAIRFLKEAGAFAGLVGYLFGDIVVWLVTALSALALVFLQDQFSLPSLRVFAGLWIYLPAAGALAFTRSMFLFSTFLKRSATEDGKLRQAAPSQAA